MSSAATKSVVAEALRQLSKDAFEKFCFCLHDRREDPRVTRTDLADQSVETISDMLLSKFSPAKAVEITIDLLREMTCNSTAGVLGELVELVSRVSVLLCYLAPFLLTGPSIHPMAETPLSYAVRQTGSDLQHTKEEEKSRTRALLDKGHPTFRRTSSGELDLQPSQEALIVQKQSGMVPVKTAQEVKAEAKKRVRSECGSPNGDGGMVLVLSRYKLQFGMYRGQSFKWLLENDLQYATYIITDSDKKGEPQNWRQNPLTSGPLMDNKNSLREYAMAFREFRQAKSLRLAQNGNARVAFGKYKELILRELYQDPSKRSYVNYLRSQESLCSPGSKMEVAIDYILYCDRIGVSADHQQTANRTGFRL